MSRPNLSVSDDQIDFGLYMTPDEEWSRIVGPQSLYDKALDLSTGKTSMEGLHLPWKKAHDKVLLRRGKVTIVTGITHHGKTNLLKQLMLHAIKQGEKVCIASMEETPEETLLDIVRMGMVHSTPDADDIDVFAAWAEGKLWFYDQQNLVDPDRMIAVMNYCAREKGVTHFVIDSLMRMDMRTDDYDRQRTWFNKLGVHARGKVHAYVVAHGRKSNDEDSPMNIFDIKGAAEMINQADVILNVWRNKKSRKNRTVKDVGADALLIVEKQRGIKPKWLGPIALWMDEDSGQFMAERDDQPEPFHKSIDLSARKGNSGNTKKADEPDSNRGWMSYD